jgi:hypothetical protein
MQPVSRSNQTAYKWGEGSVGWPLIDTDGLMVVEATMVPGCSEKRHHPTKLLNVFKSFRALR